MDSLFSVIYENEGGMGSVSIFQDGVEVYQNAIGFSSFDPIRKNKSETKYRIGSISKVFTATIILQLVDEEKIGLDTKLANFFPNIANADDITIEQLLNHTSGVFSLTDDQAYQEWMQLPMSRTDLVKIMAEYDPVFRPGEQKQYSNSNYVLLTLIAEQIENEEFGLILQRRIANPLSLKGTYFGGKIDPNNDEARSYTRTDQWVVGTETDMSIPLGAGGVVSTARDLNIFLSALMNGEILSSKSLSSMMEVERNYGLGLMKINFDNQDAYGHNGAIDGFKSNAFYFPQKELAITYLSNAEALSVDLIFYGVLSIYLNSPYDLPSFNSEYQYSKGQLKKYEGVYSSGTFPLKVTIFREGKALMAQATGQSAFRLMAYDEDKFEYTRAGIKIHFYPSEGLLILNQRGTKNSLSKE